MRITIELEPVDIARLNKALRPFARVARDADEADILNAAKHALDSLPIATAPSFVRKRINGVQRLIAMLEDEAWALPRPQREDVLEALVYFSDPEDLIPDEIEVLGLLDDAIVLELVLRRLQHVLRAYADFCKFRETLGSLPRAPDLRRAHAKKLALRRDALRARMGRRIATAKAAKK